MTRRGDQQRMQRKLTLLLRELDLPYDASASELCSAVQRKRGKDLILQAIDMPLGRAGAWIETDHFDLVLYPRAAVASHQRHIVCHEFGHMLLEHETSQDSPQISQLLVPNLDPGTVRRLLSRSQYDDGQERDAERFASVFGYRRLWVPAQHSGPVPPDAAEIIQRIQLALAS